MSVASMPSLNTAYDVELIRQDFPILHQEIHGRPLVYLDNSATSQKPKSVIEAISTYYQRDNANVHRGVHELSERATSAYENAREACASFLNAPDSREIVFTRQATEAINLVAHTWGRENLGPEDEVLISAMEHHSNIVPWQIVCQQTGASLRVIPVTESGELDLDQFDSLLTEKTKLLSIVHVSNALGTVNPVVDLTARAHAVGARVLIDGAQSTPHSPVDVQALGCDFFVFSGHKVYGPTGIGALWAKLELLETMPPYQSGGEMIQTVSFEKSTYHHVPHKFEAGTPNIQGAVGLHAAIDYVRALGLEAIAAHEHQLLQYATEALSAIPGLRIIGQARDKAGIVSFVIDGAHAHDVGTIVDSQGVAIRVGHHCTMPLHEHFGLAATARASFGLYNTTGEIDVLVEAIGKAQKMLAA